MLITNANSGHICQWDYRIFCFDFKLCNLEYVFFTISLFHFSKLKKTGTI